MPDTRVTSLPVEAMIEDEPDTRVTSLVVEAIVEDEPNTRVTSLVVEAMYYTPALPTGGAGWGVQAGVA